MIRQILTIAIPLLAPTLVYLIWGWYMHKKKQDLAEGKRLQNWQTWPWRYLVGSGALLTVLSLLLLGVPTNGQISGTYVPPKMIDGELVPGHFIPDPQE